MSEAGFDKNEMDVLLDGVYKRTGDHYYGLMEPLIYFTVLMETCSISKTADELYASKSGVARKLDKFEYQLGVRLFERTVYGLKPTDAAYRLYRAKDDFILAYNKLIYTVCKNSQMNDQERDESNEQKKKG